MMTLEGNIKKIIDVANSILDDNTSFQDRQAIVKNMSKIMEDISKTSREVSPLTTQIKKDIIGKWYKFSFDEKNVEFVYIDDLMVEKKYEDTEEICFKGHRIQLKDNLEIRYYSHYAYAASFDLITNCYKTYDARDLVKEINSAEVIDRNELKSFILESFGKILENKLNFI